MWGWGTEKKSLGRTKQSTWVEEIELRILEEDKAAKIPKAVYQKYTQRELQNLKKFPFKSWAEY